MKISTAGALPGSKLSQYGAFLIMALAMAATRSGHLGTTWTLPDASWAVFFLAGFYLADQRWALPALLLEAIVIDFVAIHYYGVSDYCLTLAYWFIVPAYSLLWLGGRWLHRHYRHRPGDLVRLALSLVASVTLCFLLTQGSFYWLGSRVSDPTILGWWGNFADWYGRFLTVTCAYVVVVAIGHAAVMRWLPARSSVRVR